MDRHQNLGDHGGRLVVELPVVVLRVEHLCFWHRFWHTTRLERLFDLIWLTVFVLAGSRDLKALRIASSSVSGFKTVAPILFWPLGALPSWAVDPIAVPSSSSLSKKGFPGSGVVAGFDFVSRFTAPSSSMALSTRESCQDPRRSPL